MPRFSSSVPLRPNHEDSPMQYGQMIEQCGDCGLFDRNCQFCKAWGRVLSPRSSIWKNCPFKVPFRAACELERSHQIR